MTLFDQYLQRATVENVSSTSEKLYRGIFEEDIADYIAIVFDLTPVVLDSTWYQLHYRCVFQFCVYFTNAC
jgi:hypothetical protein